MNTPVEDDGCAGLKHPTSPEFAAPESHRTVARLRQQDLKPRDGRGGFSRRTEPAHGQRRELSRRSCGVSSFENGRWPGAALANTGGCPGRCHPTSQRPPFWGRVWRESRIRPLALRRPGRPRAPRRSRRQARPPRPAPQSVHLTHCATAFKTIGPGPQQEPPGTSARRVRCRLREQDSSTRVRQGRPGGSDGSNDDGAN